MSSIEVAQIIGQIKQEITVDASGRGKASMKATARLAGVSDKAIGKALESANLEPSKLALMLMEQGFDGANLKEWKTNGIPDIAIAIILDYYAYEAGRYCTKQARVICRTFKTIGVRAWMQDITGWKNTPHQEPSPPKAIAPSHEAAQLAMMLGEFAGLDKSLTAQLAVNAATAVNPALKPAADELKTAIAITNVSDDAYLKPTDIGQVVGMSAVAVNNWLVQSGLQYRTQDKKIPYRPTETGKQWGRMVPTVARPSNQTVFQLRWLPSITELFEQGEKTA